MKVSVPISIISIVLLSFFSLSGQDIIQQLEQLESQKATLQTQMAELDVKIIDLKAQKSILDLKAIGLPTENYIEHSAMILEYAEAHEQAAWVSHIILPDIKDGKEYRTEDFRIDPLVTSGTAIEEDYFLKTLLPDNTYEYDGYGYDRGHLAPSADFKWNLKALSESFFYSNMSPQVEELNQDIWQELESNLRKYVVRNDVPLYIVTLPILHDELPKQTRAINKLSIPEQYIKVALDATNKRGIAFLLANSKATKELSQYAITIDEAEAITGYDFFAKYESQEVEESIDKEEWFPLIKNGDKEPLYAPSLPKNHFNTQNASIHANSGKEITVCGNVVGTNYTKYGKLYINLDKQYPNHVFSVYIMKEDLVNFQGDITNLIESKDYCFKGKVMEKKGVLQMKLSNNKKMKPFKKAIQQ